MSDSGSDGINSKPNRKASGSGRVRTHTTSFVYRKADKQYVRGEWGYRLPTGEFPESASSDEDGRERDRESRSRSRSRSRSGSRSGSADASSRRTKEKDKDKPEYTVIDPNSTEAIALAARTKRSTVVKYASVRKGGVLMWDKKKGGFNVDLDAEELELESSFAPSTSGGARHANSHSQTNDMSFASSVARDLARWRAQNQNQSHDMDVDELDSNAMDMDVDMPPPLQVLRRAPTPPPPPPPTVPKVELSVEARLFLELSKHPLPEPEDDDLPDFEELEDFEEEDELGEEAVREAEQKAKEAEEKAELERVRREAEKERSEEIRKGKAEELEALRCVCDPSFFFSVSGVECGADGCEELFRLEREKIMNKMCGYVLFIGV